MPRKAREKHNGNMHHIMIRSISEIDLFKDDSDKVKYFSLINRYQIKFGFKVYAYCLMDNHGHIVIDTGSSDISKIMHAINFCYAQYYNRKYKRHGHVFQDRFKSKVINSDRYFIVLTAYIHNNPKDLPRYKDNVSLYPFSSLCEYLNKTNTFDILNHSYLWIILKKHNIADKSKYLKLIFRSDLSKNIEDMEFNNEKKQYNSEYFSLVKNLKLDIEGIITIIAKHFKTHPKFIHVKYMTKITKFRAVCCFFMNSICDISQKEICEIVGNITQSRVSALSNIGMDILERDNNLIEQIFNI